ncbi:Rv3654c family TadE-like protein [Streptomyces qinglanensis]|uniref:Rv3654c family TadE-like protein n=1 Tax=Streptomyces qinglanensis TaxID=943816 RepID=UPI003789EE58
MAAGSRDDRGSASVWAALSVVVLCGVFAGVLGFGQAVWVRHRAGAAADLAALAAADRALAGQARACATARRVARAQHTRVARCTVRGEIADLETRLRWGPFTAHARARAGPADLPTADLPTGATGPSTGGRRSTADGRRPSRAR